MIFIFYYIIKYYNNVTLSMTRTKIAAIMTATVLVVASLYIGSNVLAPAAAGSEPPRDSVLTACARENVQHWDKIIFSSKKDILNKEGVVIFDKKEIFDIKVIDDPTKIERPLLKAAEKFNRVGWTTEKGEPFTPKDLKLIDIEYAIVCVEIGLGDPGDPGFER